MEQPKVSVIMPVYNTGAYLDEAIQSVVDQELKDWELIIINDGSTDDSLAKLEVWTVDERLILVSQTNQGLSAARNKGLEYVKGQYVYFMDSDDYLRSDALSTCYAYCEAQDLDFVFFDATVFSREQLNPDLIRNFEYNRKITTPYHVQGGREAFSEQQEVNEFFSSACMIFTRADFLRSNKLLFEPGILHEDELFMVLLYLSAQKVAYLPEKFFSRRVRSDSIMTRAFTWYNLRSYFTVAERLSDLAMLSPSDRSIIEKYIARMLNAAIWKAHVMPLSDRLKLFWKCITQWPRFVQMKTLLVLLLKQYKS